MPQARAKAKKSSARISLDISSSPAAAWEGVVLPWFETVGLAALENEQPVAVVTPFPSAAMFLRSKLLEHGIPLLGVRFMTPAVLREFLLADGAQALPLREHLRLLLAIAAESAAGSKDADSAAVAASAEEALAAIAKSIARAQDNLLRTFDQLSAAGWS